MGAVSRVVSRATRALPAPLQCATLYPRVSFRHRWSCNSLSEGVIQTSLELHRWYRNVMNVHGTCVAIDFVGARCAAFSVLHVPLAGSRFSLRRRPSLLR